MATGGDTYNTEHTEIASNFEKILKYGEDLTVLYDVESGKEISLLFEKENAKYD